LVVALIPARPSAARSAIFAFVAVVLLAASIRPKGNPQAIAMSLIKMGPVSANGSMDARPHVKSHASYAFTSPTLVSLSGEKARRSGFLHTLLAYYREMRMLLHGALPAERSGGKIATVLCMSNSHKAHCKGSSRSNFDDPTNHVRVRQRCGEG